MANNINEKKLFSKCILLSVEKLETNGRTQHSQKTAAMIFPGYFLRSVPCQRRFPVDAVCCVDRRQSSAQRARGSKRCAEPVSGQPVHGRKLCSAVAPTSAEQEAAILQLDACSTVRRSATPQTRSTLQVKKMVTLAVATCSRFSRYQSALPCSASDDVNLVTSGYLMRQRHVLVT